MSEFWKVIEGDDHVISFGTEISKSGQIKNIILSQIQDLIGRALPDKGMTNIKLHNNNYINIAFEKLIIFPAFHGGTRECEILFLGNSAWQKGQLKITGIIEPSEGFKRIERVGRNYKSDETVYYQSYSYKVTLEFLPEIAETETIDPNNSLDDIRQEIYR